jgi:hypothetical protein
MNRSSWIDKVDNTVMLELSGIMFWVVKAESYGQAVAISLNWNSGKMKYPNAECSKAL